MSDSLEKLYAAVLATKAGKNGHSRTAKLLKGGRLKIARKVVEEAAEVGFESVLQRREAMIRESADLIYNLVVLWADAGMAPRDVWQEMDRREKAMGIAEKVPKRLPVVRRKHSAMLRAG